MSENNSRKVFDSLVSRTKIYLVIILILLIALGIFVTAIGTTVY